MSQSLCHAASSGRPADLKLCPLTFVGQCRAQLSSERCYSRLPGQETMVRVILPRSSFRNRTRAVWVIPQVLFPFTSSKMSPHLCRRRWRSGRCSKMKNSTHQGYDSYSQKWTLWPCDLCEITIPWRPWKKRVTKKGLSTLSCHHYTLASPQRWNG